jgi:hypothetical protein
MMVGRAILTQGHWRRLMPGPKVLPGLGLRVLAEILPPEVAASFRLE